MSDDQPSQTPPEAVAAATPPAKPAKKPGLIRRSGVILLVILGLGVWASVPYVIEPWIEESIHDGIVAAGLEAGPDTVFTVDLFAGKIHGTDVDLRETHAGETRTILAAKTLEIDVSLSDLLGGDVILDALVATEVRGDFRRRGDGTIPLITPEEEEDGKPSKWGKLDWWGYAKKAYTWWDEREREQQEAEAEEQRNPQPPPPPKPNRDEAWKQATRYEPVAPPGRGPRFMIRTLTLSGAGVKLPDDSAFEITQFTLSGSNVCLMQLPDETMQIDATVQTSGAGPLTLGLLRKPGSDGQLSLVGESVPVQALADPKISGDSLARYKPTGTTALNVAAQWQGSDLTGRITSTVSGLDFTPPAGDTTAQQAHQVISRLDGRPIEWPIEFGGTWSNPKITDSGVDDLIKGSLKDAVTDAAKDEATKRATEELNKQLDKNPELKEATDALGGSLPNPFKKK